MQRSLSLLFIGLFFGAGLGFLVAASYGVTLDGHDHASPHDHSTHDHNKTTDIPAGPNAPTVALTVQKDAVSGWNLHVITTNFRFAPEAVNSENAAGEGHAHVYVNGENLARIYSPWMHIAALPSGPMTLSVSLNANDHSPVRVDGQNLTAQTVIQVE